MQVHFRLSIALLEDLRFSTKMVLAAQTRLAREIMCDPLTLLHHACENEFTDEYNTVFELYFGCTEHQPNAWSSFFMDLHFLIFHFPARLVMCIRTLRDEHVFMIIYAVVASYFAGVMVRLMLTLTLVVSVSPAVALSSLIDTYLDPTKPNAGDNKSDSSSTHSTGTIPTMTPTTPATPATKKKTKKNKEKEKESTGGVLGELVSNAASSAVAT